VTTNTTRYAFTAAPTVAGQVRITTTQIPLAVVVAPVITSGGSGVTPVVNPVAPLILAPIIDGMLVTPVTQPLLTAITLLPTAPAVAAALAQLAPGAAGLDAPQVSYRANRQFHDLLASNLEADAVCGPDGQPFDTRRARLEDGSGCPATGERARWWAAGLGQVSSQDDRGGFDGNDTRTVGAVLAYDAPVAPAWRLGVAGQYRRSTIDSNSGTSEAEVASYQGTIYAGYAPGPAYINGALSYGQDSYKASRSVSFPGINGVLRADYDGSQFTAFVTTGRHYYPGAGTAVVTPFASLQYTRLNVDAYGETGDPALNLNVAAQTYDFAESSVGLKASSETRLSGSRVLRPEVHVAWLHAFGDDVMIDTATFASGGQAFTTPGRTTSRDALNLGAGVIFAAGNKWSLEGTYDVLWRGESYTAQRMMITFVMRM
jgi:uncharacterized protein with beta-barrel porin domain